MLLRFAITIATLITIALAFMIAIGFVCFAVYLALLDRLSPPLAALATAGAALVFAGLIALISHFLVGLTRSRRVTSGNWATELGKVVGEEFAKQADAHPHRTAIASLLSGFAVGASPELRQLLKDLLVR